MSSIPIVCLSFAVQVFFGVMHWQLVGKGRLFTRPLWRVPGFHPPRSPYTGNPLYAAVRLRQIIAGALIEMAATFITGHEPRAGAIYAVTIIVLYLDDYFTGDDDKWKKVKDTVKNTIKWKMKLPETATE